MKNIQTFIIKEQNNEKKTIKIVKIEVGKEPFVKEIPNELKAMQTEVGGLIQPLELGRNCIAVINEEGKINGSLPNRWLGDNEIICGDFFICADGGDDFKSLNEVQIEICKEYFKEIPKFSGEEQELEPRIEVIGFSY